MVRGKKEKGAKSAAKIKLATKRKSKGPKQTSNPRYSGNNYLKTVNSGADLPPTAFSEKPSRKLQAFIEAQQKLQQQLSEEPKREKKGKKPSRVRKQETPEAKPAEDSAVANNDDAAKKPAKLDSYEDRVKKQLAKAVNDKVETSIASALEALKSASDPQVQKSAKMIEMMKEKQFKTKKQLKNKMYWQLREEKKQKKEAETKLKQIVNSIGGKVNTEDIEGMLSEKNLNKKRNSMLKKKKKGSRDDSDDDDESDFELDVDTSDMHLDFAKLQDHVDFGEQAYQPPDISKEKERVKRRHDNMLKRIKLQQQIDKQMNKSVEQIEDEAAQQQQEQDEEKIKARSVQMMREKVIQNYKENQLKRVAKKENPDRTSKQWQTFAARAAGSGFEDSEN